MLPCCTRRWATPWPDRHAVLPYAVFLLGLVTIVGLLTHACFVLRLRLSKKCLRHSDPTVDTSCSRAYVLFDSQDFELAVWYAMVLLGVCLVVTRIAVLLRQRDWRLAEVPGLIAAQARKAWGWACLLPALSPGLDNLQAARVLRKVEERRLRYARIRMDRFSLLSCFTVSFGVAVTIARAGMLGRAEGSGEQRQEMLHYVLGNEALPIIFLTVVSTVPVLLPVLMTPRGLDCVSVALAALWAWKFAVMDEEGLDYNRYWIMVCAWTLASMGNARLTILLTVMVSCVDIGIHALLYEHADYYFYREFLAMSMVCLVIWNHEERQIAEVRAEVRAQTSDLASTLVHSVLSTMCDAVVRLDAELRLAEPCPRLSSLLLRQGPLPAGFAFADLMPREEADRFRTCLEQSAPRGDGLGGVPPPGDGGAGGRCPTFAGICHVCMSDGTGSRLSLEFFYSCMPGIDGEPTYLIGIQEDNDGLVSYPEATAACPPLPTHLVAVPEAARTEATASYSSCSVSECSEEPEGEEPCFCWVDKCSSNLVLLGCSRRFSMLGGQQGHCAAFREWLSEADWGKVCTWLASHRLQTKCSVSLRDLGMGWRYSCKLALDANRCEPTDCPESSNPVCLNVTNLHFKAFRDGGGSKDSGGGGGSSTPPADSRKDGIGGTGPGSEAPSELPGLWVSHTREDPKIRGTWGLSPEVEGLFTRNALLADWLRAPHELRTALRRALQVDERRAAHSLGSFELKEPAASAQPMQSLNVEIILERVSGRQCFLAFRMHTATGSAAGGDSDPEARTAGRCGSRLASL